MRDEGILLMGDWCSGILLMVSSTLSDCLLRSLTSFMANRRSCQTIRVMISLHLPP